MRRRPPRAPLFPYTSVFRSTIVMVLLPLLSVAVGASNVQAVPSSMLLLVLLQGIAGAAGCTRVKFWVDGVLLKQKSVACQGRGASKVVRQCVAVLVPRRTIV